MKISQIIVFAWVIVTPVILRAGTEPKYYDYVARQPWKAANHTVEGRDWSLPDWVKPAPCSNIVTAIKTTDAKFPGNKTIRFNIRWNEVEPVEGEYHFQRFLDTLDAMQRRGIEFAELHVRGCVWGTNYYKKDAQGNYKVFRRTKGTTPAWLHNVYKIPLKEGFIMKNVNPPFSVVNIDMYDDVFIDKYCKFIRALGASGIFSHPIIKKAYIQYDSHYSRGEEGNGPERNSPNKPKFDRVYRTYAEALGENVSKCMSVVGWYGDNLPDVIAMGFGQRNGFGEMYLAQLDNPQFGMSIDERGYIITDEEYAPIKEKRAWGEENEEYDPEFLPRYGPFESFPHRYREASLSLLVMRRNSIWDQNGGVTLDPHLTAFVGLELGRDVYDAPDIWCELRESYIKRRSNKTETPVKNFERWLLQRDDFGTHTTPTRKVEHGTKGIIPTGLYRRVYIKGKEYDYTARKGKKIGFYIDKRFLDGYNGNFAIKLTYYDNTDFNVCYWNSKGMKTCHVRGTGSDREMTVTLIVRDLAKARSKEFDLWVESPDSVELSMARVIKCDEQ